MKNIFAGFILLSFLLVATSVSAKTIRVKSYYKSSTGSYVNSYYKTSPNKIKFDNYSTKGNYNPYTGKSGTKNYWDY